MTPESLFKARLIKDIKEQYPGAVILKCDANYTQGIPDHLILYGKQWAAFEAKASEDSHIRPNQMYWVRYLNRMSFASFVFPENKESFLDELQRTFRSHRRARVSRS